MNAGQKRDHRAVWHALHHQLSVAFVGAGYRPHPAYPPVFEQHNRSYQCAFLGPAALDGLRLIDIYYDPHAACWNVLGHLYACPDAAARIVALGESTLDWTVALQSLPRRRCDLEPGAGWAFWRVATRRVRFDRATGAPKKLELVLDAALRGVPDFLTVLNRPGDSVASGLSSIAAAQRH